MVEVEEKVSENVVEACARTSSVRYCVFTSSLLACIWRSGTRPELPPVVDHDCWSDQSLCVDKKVSRLLKNYDQMICERSYYSYFDVVLNTTKSGVDGA